MSEIFEREGRNGRKVRRRKNLYGFEVIERDKRRVSGPKSTEIKSLHNQAYEICHLAARGFRNVDIAKIVGVTPDCVRNTVNSELGQAKISSLRYERDEDAKVEVERIRHLTWKAMDVMQQIFEDETDQVTLGDKGESAKFFLKEMSGLRAPTKVQSQSIRTEMSVEQLEEFKNRGLDAARQSGLIAYSESESESEDE